MLKMCLLCSKIYVVLIDLKCENFTIMNFEPVCGGGFTRIFHFLMSSDCGGAPSLLRRHGMAELVAWELVQVSLPSLRSLHAVLVTTVNRHVVRRVCAPPLNDVIFSRNLPIMLALCSCTYYAHFSAGIISAPLHCAGCNHGNCVGLISSLLAFDFHIRNTSQ